MSSEMNIFEPLKNESEVVELFEQLVQLKSELSIKFKNKESVLAKITQGSAKEVTLTPIKITDLSPYEEGDVSVWFNHQGRRYFFESKFLKQNKNINLLLNQNPVFQQQKRNEFRFEIPKSYKAEFQVLNHNGKSVTLWGKVLNISPHGALLECKCDFKLKSDDILVCQIFFGKHQPTTTKACLRHIIADSGLLQLGVEFQYKTIGEEDDVQELVIYLRQDVFELGQHNQAQ